MGVLFPMVRLFVPVIVSRLPPLWVKNAIVVYVDTRSGQCSARKVDCASSSGIDCQYERRGGGDVATGLVECSVAAVSNLQGVGDRNACAVAHIKAAVCSGITPNDQRRGDICAATLIHDAVTDQADIFRGSRVQVSARLIINTTPHISAAGAPTDT